jgi:hypothetical protein
MLVVVPLELDALSLEISVCPELQVVQIFAPYGPNQPFDDRMGARHVRHRLDFPDVEDPHVRLPPMKPVLCGAHRMPDRKPDALRTTTSR